MRRHRHPLVLAITLALGAPLASAQAPATAATTTVVRCGALIDVDGGRKLDAHSIVVRGDRIAEVRAGSAEIDGAAVVDLSRHTCMPGLMDMHVHITDETSKDKYSEGFRLNPPDYAFRSVVLAERTLMAGFTTVRHLGDDGVVSVSLRNAIAQGLVKGPRIYTAGKSIATTGGHADPTNGWARRMHGRPGSDRRRGQLARGSAQGRAPALQGKRRPDQDHRHRRRAAFAKNGAEPAVHRGGGQGHRRHRAATTASRSPRTRTATRACARAIVGRRGLDRARHLHERRDHAR